MLGYLYYWFACHYYKRAYKADHPVHFSAAIAVGAIQFSLVYNAYMVYIMFFPLNMNVAYKTPVTVAVLAVVAVVCWFNYRFLFMFGLFFFPALVSFVFHLFF